MSGTTISVDSNDLTAVKLYSLFSSLSQPTTIHLGGCDFLVWESIVLPLIKGIRLEEYISGLVCSPAKVVSSNTSNL
ncbi:hypothetical protein QN277_003773 [Acacia crassicarpa]|uniref:Uncharacterized protein n=1 Tax=Acacia crassicarpa TaxID=499986 RepID=A0AAE1K017_9FABA|nr:hypothetical protein QN277_003773 [Acacia crassicarpa]